ncbi:MAG: hypothetical protein IJW54_02620 [Clostridia bacterium]|nr:hypothetical protein [Clostridia bacterium]
MYGTTMRNYNVNKASKSKDERGFFSSKFSFKKQAKEKKARETRYLRIEKNEMPKIEKEKNTTSESFFSKKDFPIPSVIITVLLTMMFLVVVSGIASL